MVLFYLSYLSPSPLLSPPFNCRPEGRREDPDPEDARISARKSPALRGSFGGAAWWLRVLRGRPDPEGASAPGEGWLPPPEPRRLAAEEAWERRAAEERTRGEDNWPAGEDVDSGARARRDARAGSLAKYRRHKRLLDEGVRGLKWAITLLFHLGPGEAKWP